MPIAPRRVSAAARLARDPEVDEHRAAVVEDDVGGLDVAVHDVLGVHVGERLAHLADMLDRLGERQPAAFLEHAGQARAAHQLHHQAVAGRRRRGGRATRTTRGMAQARQQPRLDLEARRVALLEQQLERDLGAVGEPAAAVDRAHPAAGDPRDDLVGAADLGPRRQIVAVRLSRRRSDVIVDASEPLVFRQRRSQCWNASSTRRARFWLCGSPSMPSLR